MIYVVEGADGTGKSTLAEEISREKKAHVQHATYREGWDIGLYHHLLMANAKSMEANGINVVFDRWAPSEAVYGEVFRGGESYNTKTLMKKYGRHIIWVYCWNEEVIRNHEKNKKARHEMFDDMSEVVKKYGEFVVETSVDFNWTEYNFMEDDIEEFVGRLP